MADVRILASKPRQRLMPRFSPQAVQSGLEALTSDYFRLHLLSCSLIVHWERTNSGMLRVMTFLVSISPPVCQYNKQVVKVICREDASPPRTNLSVTCSWKMFCLNSFNIRRVAHRYCLQVLFYASAPIR